MGYNYDWFVGDGLMIVNKRNVSKTAIMLNPGIDNCQPVNWTSKYGSITFTQAGRELSLNGMNEAGLVVNILGLHQSQYPASDSRPCISEFQWIQYQLDNFSRVEQVIGSDSQIRILPQPSKEGSFHYFVCDSMGDCAVIEFIDGKMVHYTKETMRVKVLSNERYDDSISILNTYKSWGGELPVPQNRDPYARFVCAADMVKNYDPKTSGSVVDYAFNILTDVEWSVPTQWRIVYDVKNLKILFYTPENKQIRHLALSAFNFSCKTSVMLMDVNNASSGDVIDKFVDYSYQRNGDLIRKVFNYPEDVIDRLSRYPESTVCMDK